jgi:hypothetical protein
LETTYFAGIYDSIERAYDSTGNQNRGTYPKGERVPALFWIM